jgi:hypothetical protein
MSLPLASPSFWSVAESSIGKLLTDGSLRYVVLDKTFRMVPLVRNSKSTFTDFLLSDPDAKGCKVAINGNMFDVTRFGLVNAVLTSADTPDETLIQGQVVQDGKKIAGDSRPDSFWFGQVLFPFTDSFPWAYTADKGDPPITKATAAALGGLGPMIISKLPFGIANKYRPGAPPGTVEPAVGEPPPAAKSYMVQRSNATFASVSKRSPDTGKAIVAYCFAKRALLIAVQKDKESPGQTHSVVADALASQGFDTAVFMDGSDSATMMLDGKIIVAPGDLKNATIEVGLGFRS